MIICPCNNCYENRRYLAEYRNGVARCMRNAASAKREIERNTFHALAAIYKAFEAEFEPAPCLRQKPPMTVADCPRGPLDRRFLGD